MKGITLCTSFELPISELWAVAAWQNVSREELIGILLATLLMLAGIMLAAFIIIAGCKLALRLVQKLGRSSPSGSSASAEEGE